MRKKWQKQMPLMPQITDHNQSKELAVISTIEPAQKLICSDVQIWSILTNKLLSWLPC
jgi:hypothetical protein